MADPTGGDSSLTPYITAGFAGLVGLVFTAFRKRVVWLTKKVRVLLRVARGDHVAPEELNDDLDG